MRLGNVAAFHTAMPETTIREYQKLALGEEKVGIPQYAFRSNLPAFNACSY
jgi:hypothetical protein